MFKIEEYQDEIMSELEFVNSVNSLDDISLQQRRPALKDKTI